MNPKTENSYPQVWLPTRAGIARFAHQIKRGTDKPQNKVAPRGSGKLGKKKAKA